MSEDSTATKNPVTCQADFTYSITPKTLVIKMTRIRWLEVHDFGSRGCRFEPCRVQVP